MLHLPCYLYTSVPERRAVLTSMRPVLRGGEARDRLRGGHLCALIMYS